MAIDQASVRAWMERFAEAIAEHREELVELDTAIGDGDHGTNMDRGMRRAIEQLAAQEPDRPGAILKAVAMTLIGTVGGASGPLYGTLLLALSGGFADRSEVDLETYASAWRGALAAVQARGHAQAGDKTMLDALIPAVAALEDAAREGSTSEGSTGEGSTGEAAAREGSTGLNTALAQAAAAAHDGMLATTPLLARRGRASYLGERSTGHQDPGATSTFLLFQTASQALSD